VLAGFQIVFFTTPEMTWPAFQPIPGLDSPEVVPFLIDVVEQGPDWTDQSLLDAHGGMYPHIARCYAVMCLGSIQDQRAFAPLVSTLRSGDYLADRFEITYARKDRYDIRDYAALALGYLGNSDAVEPLIEALTESEQPWAVFGLTMLRDPRAIRPIIEYSNALDKLDYRTHRCLEYISRARFSIRYSTRTQKYSISEFPELGELDPSNVYLLLWRHWLQVGDAFAKRQFELWYPRWKRLLQERPEDTLSQDYVLFDMVRGGVAVLPYLLDEIAEGDESLLHAVEFIREGGPIAGSSTSDPSLDRAACLSWWEEDKERWLVFDPNAGE
jgi:hypothetical protein